MESAAREISYHEDYPSVHNIKPQEFVDIDASLINYVPWDSYYHEFDVFMAYRNTLPHSVLVDTKAMFEAIVDVLPSVIFRRLHPDDDEMQECFLVDYEIGETCTFRLSYGDMFPTSWEPRILSWTGPYTEVFTDPEVFPSLVRSLVIFASLQQDKHISDSKIRIDMKLPPNTKYQAHQLPRSLMPRPELCQVTLCGKEEPVYAMTHVPTCRQGTWYLRCNYDPPSARVDTVQDLKFKNQEAPDFDFIVEHDTHVVPVKP